MPDYQAFIEVPKTEDEFRKFLSEKEAKYKNFRYEVRTEHHRPSCHHCKGHAILYVEGDFKS